MYDFHKDYKGTSSNKQNWISVTIRRQQRSRGKQINLSALCIVTHAIVLCLSGLFFRFVLSIWCENKLYI